MSKRDDYVLTLIDCPMAMTSICDAVIVIVNQLPKRFIQSGALDLVLSLHLVEILEIQKLNCEML